MTSVTSSQQISLNGMRYRIKGPVRRAPASLFPEQVRLGDVSRDTHPNSSAASLTTWPGGIGLEQFEDGVAKRSWWSTCSQRYKSLTLPGLAVQTGDQDVSGSYTSILASYLPSGGTREVYGAFGTAVKKYNPTTDAWGSALDTLPAAATDVLETRIGGTNYLIFAHTGGYTYFDGTTWTDDTADTKYLAYHDAALWGMDANGAFWVATTIGTEASKAQLPVPDGYVTDLFTYRDTAGEIIIYAMSKTGLWTYDQTNDVWFPSEFTVPLHPRSGRGSRTWRDVLLVPAGLSVYAYKTTDAGAAVTVAGPDLDDGLPMAQRGEIKKLEAAHNDLLALVDGGSLSVALAEPVYRDHIKGYGSHGSLPMMSTKVSATAAQKGGATILGWNGSFWETKWLSETTDGSLPDDLIVSDAYNQYRMWWVFDQRVYFMDLPASVVNPSQISNFEYARSSTHEWPWFTGDDEGTDKLALAVVGTALGMSGDETASLRYQLDFLDSETAIGTISSNGSFEFPLPDAVTPEGVPFRAFRLVAGLERGAGNINDTPQIRNVDIIYEKRLPLKWSYEVDIDFRASEGGRSSLALKQAIETAIESETLVTFNYHDESQGETVRYVRVLGYAGRERAGHDFGDEATLALTEI